jgi:hypothetical protein
VQVVKRFLKAATAENRLKSLKLPDIIIPGTAA